tara:strand:+ start:789 stop:1832 length:1044 start_codon:yes stop_codon:yes gene_type:complete
MYNSTIDQSNMYKSIFDFSNHIKEAFEFFDKNSSLNSNLKNEIDSIMVLGMGGSAITGLLIKDLLKNDVDIPMHVNQGYDIPKWVNNKTLIIACSYSGNTEETLDAFEKCHKENAKIIGFTTGGKLFELVEKYNYEYVLMPKGLQPRAAIGYSFSLMLMLLNKIELIDELLIKSLKNSPNPLMKKTEQFSLNNNNNIAYSIANKIYNKNPLIYAEEGIFNTIGYRFKCQLVENSKVLAFNNAVPEMNHNEIEAYTNTVNIKNNFVVIWINDSAYHTRNKKRIKIVSNILENKVKEQFFLEIEEHNENKILKYLSYIHLVDWISYHTAILNKIDPSIIPNINELKKSL